MKMPKLVTGFVPRSSPSMGQRPSFDFWSSWCRYVNVLLCLLVLSLAVYRHPLSMCVLVSGDCHFVHMGDGLYFLWHRWIWTPYAISFGPVWGSGVCMDGVVRSRDCCFMEDVSIDGARVCHGAEAVHLDKFAEAGMEIG